MVTLAPCRLGSQCYHMSILPVDRRSVDNARCKFSSGAVLQLCCGIGWREGILSVQAKCVDDLLVAIHMFAKFEGLYIKSTNQHSKLRQRKRTTSLAALLVVVGEVEAQASMLSSPHLSPSCDKGGLPKVSHRPVVPYSNAWSSQSPYVPIPSLSTTQFASLGSTYSRYRRMQ